ncbi:hypothetical protein B0T17DRAFT_596733 [Bombardia bombarda]|uniref:Uncharacterized protein n=1 Tax=Bombardia bombarda TaxID=252184 RepID=A0AA40CG19_9PEZI|nr:hypothetical protein B0T17DRAFT_596733 [Bombardia bombarda]
MSDESFKHIEGRICWELPKAIPLSEEMIKYIDGAICWELWIKWYNGEVKIYDKETPEIVVEEAIDEVMSDNDCDRYHVQAYARKKQMENANDKNLAAFWALVEERATNYYLDEAEVRESEKKETQSQHDAILGIEGYGNATGNVCHHGRTLPPMKTLK